MEYKCRIYINCCPLPLVLSLRRVKLHLLYAFPLRSCRQHEKPDWAFSRLDKHISLGLSLYVMCSSTRQDDSWLPGLLQDVNICLVLRPVLGFSVLQVWPEWGERSLPQPADCMTEDLVRLSSESPVFGKDCKTILSAVFVADSQETSASYRNSGFALILKESRLENN